MEGNIISLRIGEADMKNPECIADRSGHHITSKPWSDIDLSKLQSNLNSSNTDGSFTMANSNSFLSPYEILPTDQENKYLRKLPYFIMKLFVVCTH